MASIARRPDGQYRARYRDAERREHSHHFSRKVDAQRWLDQVTAAVQTGTYVDPRRSAVTVGDLAAAWLASTAHLKPSTASRYGHAARRHVLPRWGATPLASVQHSDVQGWVSELTRQGLSAETVRKTYRVLSMVLTAAVRDGRIARNPADKVNLPRPERREMQYLTHAQTHALAGLTGRYRLVVLTLAHCGLRWGEMAALRVGRVDLMRRRLIVAESVTPVDGVMTWGSPKSYERREVPIPRFLADELAAHIAGREPGDLVFTGERGGQALRVQVFRRAAFNRGAVEVGAAGLRPHDLRHTAASLAIASGASVKVVQRMLGHASAAITLDRYGHLYGDDLDTVAERLHAASESARGQVADYLRTIGEVVRLNVAAS